MLKSLLLTIRRRVEVRRGLPAMPGPGGMNVPAQDTINARNKVDAAHTSPNQLKTGSGMKEAIFGRPFRTMAAALTFAVYASLGAASFTEHAQADGAPAAKDRTVDRNMEKVAQRIYRSAQQFYFDRAYWKAARELIILLDYYPAFTQADGVLCHLGESLYSMDMFNSSHKMFRFLITKFPHSEYLSQGLYGLQRIQYQAENYAESLKLYDAIAGKYAGAAVMDGVHYFGGMARFHQHDYDAAIEALNQIGARSEYYDYGLYTIGLCHLKKKASSRLWQPCAR